MILVVRVFRFTGPPSRGSREHVASRIGRDAHAGDGRLMELSTVRGRVVQTWDVDGW